MRWHSATYTFPQNTHPHAKCNDNQTGQQWHHHSIPSLNGFLSTLYIKWHKRVRGPKGLRAVVVDDNVSIMKRNHAHAWGPIVRMHNCTSINVQYWRSEVWTMRNAAISNETWTALSSGQKKRSTRAATAARHKQKQTPLLLLLLYIVRSAKRTALIIIYHRHQPKTHCASAPASFLRSKKIYSVFCQYSIVGKCIETRDSGHGSEAHQLRRIQNPLLRFFFIYISWSWSACTIYNLALGLIQWFSASFFHHSYCLPHKIRWPLTVHDWFMVMLDFVVCVISRNPPPQ